MAKITFEKGDWLSFPQKGMQNGHGICLGGDVCLMIKGEGGRTTWVVEKGTLPTGALPVICKLNVHYEKKLALDAVEKAIC